MILDTSALFAMLRAGDPDGSAVLEAMASRPLRVVSPYVVAELDYLVQTRFGVRAELEVLDELAGGAYELPTMGLGDLLACAAVIARFHDLGVGVTDASLVVLAERYGTDEICTLDRRHFAALRSATGRPFTLLP